MTLQQLRFLTAIVESDFNITAAAARVSATQPALSRQLLLLEQELGFQIFSRNGRGLSRMTEAGEQVIAYARRVLREAQNIKNLSADLNAPRSGELRVGSTHTEARYVLPQVIARFRPLFPGVRLSVHQGMPEQVAEMARLNQVDIVIAAGARDAFVDLVLLSCYRSRRRVVVPASHPLTGMSELSLETLAKFPLASHDSSTGEASVDEVFGAAGMKPHVILTSPDAELVKRYTRQENAVGIIAEVARDAENDQDLVTLDASHLFPEETTWAGFSRNGLPRDYTYEFLRLLAPELTQEVVERARTRSAARTARVLSSPQRTSESSE